MHAMTMDEMVKAGTAVGPQRLRELLFRFVGKSRKPSQLCSSAPAVSSATANLEAVIPELLAEAFADKTFLPGVSWRSDNQGNSPVIADRAQSARCLAADRALSRRDAYAALAE